MTGPSAPIHDPARASTASVDACIAHPGPGARPAPGIHDLDIKAGLGAATGAPVPASAEAVAARRFIPAPDPDARRASDARMFLPLAPKARFL